jgi:hypothetical protein
MLPMHRRFAVLLRSGARRGWCGVKEARDKLVVDHRTASRARLRDLGLRTCRSGGREPGHRIPRLRSHRRLLWLLLLLLLLLLLVLLLLLLVLLLLILLRRNRSRRRGSLLLGRLRRSAHNGRIDAGRHADHDFPLAWLAPAARRIARGSAEKSNVLKCNIIFIIE